MRVGSVVEKWVVVVVFAMMFVCVELNEGLSGFFCSITWQIRQQTRRVERKKVGLACEVLTGQCESGGWACDLGPWFRVSEYVSSVP